MPNRVSACNFQIDHLSSQVNIADLLMPTHAITIKNDRCCRHRTIQCYSMVGVASLIWLLWLFLVTIMFSQFVLVTCRRRSNGVQLVLPLSGQLIEALAINLHTYVVTFGYMATQ